MEFRPAQRTLTAQGHPALDHQPFQPVLISNGKNVIGHHDGSPAISDQTRLFRVRGVIPKPVTWKFHLV